ncbi:MAG: sigma 54-interacting transcriptional regulator [Archangiaceae bacterium]|nr:sigma 54-interacting transcriptional regulator [Archangiaceae bacterium]
MSAAPLNTETLTLVHDADGAWARHPKVRLRLQVPGAARPEERELSLEPLELGSGPDCDLVCADPKVSRRHCQVSLGPDGIGVEDLGSKNGTFVAGVRVSKAWLGEGQSITLGSSRVDAVFAGQTAKVALSARPSFGSAEGLSLPMRKLFAELERVAKTDGTLLMWGETGTGKSLLARTVHEEGARADGPFVVFDCGAVPATLVDAELFGHTQGAFTGADHARPGAVRQADGGTLFLDEIGELPLSAQAALLRLLEEREVRPLGGEPVKVDVRVIAATHRDLRARVAAKEFRQDLFFRLAVLEVAVPALRQRLDDLPLLIDRFLKQRDPSRGIASLPPGLLEMFNRHSWPGNVRELRNVIERLVTFPELAPSHLLQRPGHTAPVRHHTPYGHLPLRQARDAAVEEFERQYLEEKLAEHGSNVAAAAKAMGVSRQLLYRLLSGYGLNRAP